MRYLVSAVSLAFISVVASASPVTGTLTAGRTDGTAYYFFNLTDGTHTFNLPMPSVFSLGVGIFGPLVFSSTTPSSYHLETGQVSGLQPTFDGTVIDPAAPTLRYVVDFVFSPYSGGVFVDNSVNLIPFGQIQNQTLTGASSTFTGSIQVTNFVTGACVFCWSGSGTSTTDGRVNTNTQTGDGVNWVVQNFAGSDVPEPAGMGAAGLLVLAAGIAFRMRR